MIETITESFRRQFEELAQLVPNLVAALIVLLIAYVGGRIAGHLVFVVLRETKLTDTHRIFFRRLTFWLVWLVGAAVSLSVIGLGNIATGLMASGGLTAIVIGFAFREIGENLLAGFFLAFSRPFNRGDLIQSGEYEGTVRAIELRSTHIRTADGRDIFIPNSQIFNRPLVNFTLDGLRKPEFTVGIDYGDDTAKARSLLKATVATIPGVLSEPAATVNVSGLLANHVELKVGFWVNTFDQRFSVLAVKDEAMNACREALRREDFTISTDVVSNLALWGGPEPLRIANVGS